MKSSAYLVGLMDISVSPPVLERVFIRSDNSQALIAFGKRVWIDILPGPIDSPTFKHGRIAIMKHLIWFQDSFRWLEPLMSEEDIQLALDLQDITANVIDSGMDVYA